MVKLLTHGRMSFLIMPISDEKIIAFKYPFGCSQGKFPNHKKGEVKFEIYLAKSILLNGRWG